MRMLIPLKNLPMFTVFEFGYCLYVRLTKDIVYNYSADDYSDYEFTDDTLVLPYGKLTITKFKD